MPLAYSAIECFEVKGTAREDYSIEGGIQASVRLEVSGANRISLINDLLANQRAWPALSAMTQPPRAYAASAVPFSTDQVVDGQVYTWDVYQVDVKYSTDPTRTIVSESIEPSAEFVRLDHRFFRWASGAPLTDQEAPGLLKPGLILSKTYYQQTLVPNEVLTGAGKVHNASYTSSFGLTFAAESLLYLPNPVTKTVTTAGSDGYTYTNKFSWNPYGWNKFYRPATNSWENIYDLLGNVVKPYAPANLSALLS